MKVSLLPLLCIGLMQLISCTKNIEGITSDSVTSEISSDATLADDFSTCKLRRVYQVAPAGELVTGLFTYNAAGNPYSLVYRPVREDATFFTYTYRFSYDGKARLKEIVRERQPLFEFPATITDVHKYGYDNNNVMVTDTFFRRRPGNPTFSETDVDIKVSTFTYDSLGRIVKESIKQIRPWDGWAMEPVRNPTYTYDSRGNLTPAGWRSSWYDSKVSYLRSHPLFMFITRNYSRNNPWNLNSQAQRYNSRGLPLSIENGNDYFFGNEYFFGNDAGSEAAVDIEKLIYDCQ